MRDSLKHDKMTRTLEEHFNDVYGHGCGDQAVFCVAKAIEGAAPDGAAAIRYGDDEFLVVPPCGGGGIGERLCGGSGSEDVSGKKEKRMDISKGIG